MSVHNLYVVNTHAPDVSTWTWSKPFLLAYFVFTVALNNINNNISKHERIKVREFRIKNVKMSGAAVNNNNLSNWHLIVNKPNSDSNCWSQRQILCRQRTNYFCLDFFKFGIPLIRFFRALRCCWLLQIDLWFWLPNTTGLMWSKDTEKANSATRCRNQK